jgi:hypothetical protein
VISKEKNSEVVRQSYLSEGAERCGVVVSRDAEEGSLTRFANSPSRLASILLQDAIRKLN